MGTTVQGPSSGVLIQQLGRLFQHGTAAGLPEGELLDRFVRANDESAFEVLIARHGPTVLAVCRRLLRDPNDIDDAFQATFLILVRKAGTLRRSDLLGNWLYGVAFRVANRARIVAARRSARTPGGSDLVEAVGRTEMPQDDAESVPWLLEEVHRLPGKYRVPVLLCYFEGLTHEQAAARLGCPIGTVKGQLARARELLRKRLNRRGVTVPVAVLAAGDHAVPIVRMAIPDSLRFHTIAAAQTMTGAAGTVSLTATKLADGVLRTMILHHLRSSGIALLIGTAVTTGLVLAAGQDAAKPEEKAPQPPTRARAARAITKVAAEGKTTEEETKAASEVVGLGGGVGMMMGRMRPWNESQYRIEITQLASTLARTEKDPRNQAALARLDIPLAVHFANPCPLDHILKYIKAATTKDNQSPIPIYVDPAGLQHVGATLSSTVTIDLEGVPLKMSLRLLLKQLGLAYCVRDGVLIISSVEGVREELAEAASELTGNDPDQLSHLLQSIRSQGMGMMGGGMGGGMGGMGGGGMM